MVNTANPLGNVVLGADALAQLSGIAILSYGLAVRTPSARDHAASRAALSVAPLVGGGRTGVSLVGRF